MESGTTPIALLSTISSASSLHQQNVKDGPSSTTSGIPKLMEQMSVGDLSMSLQHFGWADYFVFILMLAVCAAIGVYFGFMEKSNGKDGKGGKRKVEQRRGSEALDYLVGGRKMKVFPVSMSLVASFVSGISLLGTSTEIYVYGTQYAFILITIAFSGVVSWYIFLPVFCNLQLTSTYEYFEMRFNRRIRLFSSVLFTIGTLVWLPIVIFVPALAFNQVTGVNIHIITPVVCVVCIFYTCVGGLKAVVWTDVIQTFVMVGSIILVIIKGTMDVGGLSEVIKRNYDANRLEFPSTSFDPTIRFSAYSLILGGTIFWSQNISGNQVMMQRFLSVPNVKAARRALVYFIIGVSLLLACCMYNGLLIFATYHNCDPLSTQLAKAKDQLVPLLVMDILGIFPGLPGLFVAGVFSAALSSLSTGLNSLAAVFLEDFIKPARDTPLSEKTTAVVMRSIVVIFGIISVALVFVVERLGMVLQLSITLGSITQGPLFGLFILGLCIPWVNWKSALSGSLMAFSIMSWICIKAQIAFATGEIQIIEKPVTTEGCTYAFTPIDKGNSTAYVPPPMAIHHMSFLWYALVGACLTVIGACIASIFFGFNDTSELDENLFAPCVRKIFLKPRKYLSVQPDIKERETYFELRFDRRTRMFGSVLFVLGIIVWLPIAIYVPALTFNQVTGANIHIITPIVCIVCTFYTCVGGIKAVVWTDVIQSFFMMGSIILVIIKGTADLGGFGVVWQRNWDSGRIEIPEMTMDPTVRLSVLSVFLGGTLHKLQGSCVNQVSIQRFLSLPSIKEAKRCLIYFTIGLIVLLGSCVYTGLLTYATYYDCDPLTTKLAKATDQLVPLLVMHILGVYPGIPGLFVSGVFSAALSSLSTGLNSLAAVLLEDFVKPYKKVPLTEKQTKVLLRSIVVFFGISCIFLVVVVEKLGMVLQLTSTLSAVTQGPLLGIFVIGICLPWINGKYLELRFDSRVRLFGSVLFITSAVLWLPIAVYVPALTFNQVTGVNVHVISMMVCSVCTFYTCVGGLKAVVWTDVIQSFVMYGSIFLVMIKGTMDLGGIGVVLQRNWDSGRLEAPEMTLDPTVRMSVLAIFVGGTFMKIQHIAVNQPAVQRFISLPTMAHAKQTLIIFVIGLILLLLSCSYVGLLTYATYYDCDPLKTKLAKATDQLVPLMVMHILGMFPGLPGLFVSGVCSAALSSVSTCLNSLSAVILEDFIKPYWKSDLTEKQTAITMRFIVLFFGFSCAGLIFVVEKLGMVLQLSLTLHGITQGPLLAVFFIGMCLPWIKTKSALVGGICGFIFMGYVCVRAQTAIASGDIVFAKKPVSVEGCTYDFTPVNTTTIPNLIETSKSLHHISFLWYTALGTSVTITVAALCTIIFGTNDTSEMDHSVVAPFIRRFMKTRKYDSVTMNEKIPNELTK